MAKIRLTDEQRDKISAHLPEWLASTKGGRPRTPDRQSFEGILWILRSVNMGVAVDTPQGLLVPVVTGSQQKSLLEIAGELAGLIERARGNRLQPEDLQGGTFTITNLGMNEIDAFTPIINPPQVAILGLGRILPKPVAWQGQIRLRDMIALSLTFDHRAVDAVPAARFLQRIKQLVEDPGWIPL
jgi:pyruvate dehydrogenase E2 component (dihydrolipoamide acetyltransferase)